MTWLDAVPLVLIPVYLVLSLSTGGVIRRGIGFVGAYLACFAATNMGLQTAGILTTSYPNMPTPDARIYGFFGILAAVIILVEGAVLILGKQLEFTAVALNRFLGLAVGLITGVAVAVVVTVEFTGAASPEGNAQLDQLQISVRQIVHDSKVAAPLSKAVGKYVEVLFKPVLPVNPGAYFGPGPVV